MKRVIFYFDGFNFYYGLRDKIKRSPDWKDFYWLDFVAFCEEFISDGQELTMVKYFTAPPINPGKRTRQSALLSANKLLNPDTFEVIKGKYYTKNVSCRLCNGVSQTFDEKRTDVNISINLLLDCFQDKVDKLVLITADSDLITTVQTIKTHFPQKEIKLYFPPLRTSTELFNICKPVVYLENNKQKFENAVMPNDITDGTKTYTKPMEWR